MNHIYKSKICKNLEKLTAELNYLQNELKFKDDLLKSLENTYQKEFKTLNSSFPNASSLNETLNKCEKVIEEKVACASKICEVVDECYKTCNDDSSFILKYYSSRGLLKKMVPGIYNINDYINERENQVCFCGDFAYGPMVECIESNCEVRWFHCRCVNLEPGNDFSFLCPSCFAKNR